MIFNVLILITVCTLKILSAAKILAVFPSDYKSHFFIGRSIVKTLADRGHEITFISPFKLEYSRVESVLLESDRKKGFKKLLSRS